MRNTAATSGAAASRLGLLGGTFDPPHLGHVAAARVALNRLSLDRLLVTVANDPWQKTPSRVITSPAHRVAMTRAAFAEVPGTSVLDTEIVRGGATYTIDTVTALLRRHRGARIWLVMGESVADQLDSWHRADELRNLVEVAVLYEPERVEGGPAEPGPLEGVAPPGWRAVAVSTELVDVSSTRVRQAAGQLTSQPAHPAVSVSLSELVPAEIARYIDRHKLYRGV